MGERPKWGTCPAKPFLKLSALEVDVFSIFHEHARAEYFAGSFGFLTGPFCSTTVR